MTPPSATEDLHTRVQKAGQELLINSFSLVKTGEIHDLNNDAYTRPIKKLMDALDALLSIERGSVTLLVGENVVQVNSHALWMDPGTHEQAVELDGWLARRGTGGIKFLRRPCPTQLRRFFYEFARFTAPRDGKASMQALAERLVRAGIADLELAPQPVRIDDVGHGERGVAALWYYAKAVAAMRYVMSRTPILSKPAVRLGQELVDACAAEQDLLTALPCMGAVGLLRPVHRRVVDCAVLVAAVGRGLSLSPIHCGQLCTAALLHESGRSYEAERPHDFDTDELAGSLIVHQLAEAVAIDAEIARRVAVGMEHALGPGGAGPPYLTAAPAPSLAGQLVSLANRWLTLCLGPDGALPPPAALVRLVKDPPREVEPDLVRVFAAVVGPLPVGTVVELRDGSVQVVSEVDHIRGRGVYRAEPPAVAGARSIFLKRMVDRSGRAVHEHRAPTRLEDFSEIARVLSGEALRELVIRALFADPAIVASQIGLRPAPRG